MGNEESSPGGGGKYSDASLDEQEAANADIAASFPGRSGSKRDKRKSKEKASSSKRASKEKRKTKKHAGLEAEVRGLSRQVRAY